MRFLAAIPLVFLVLGSRFAGAQNFVAPKDLAREINQAVTPSALVISNHITTGLNGVSKGFLEAEVQFETHGKFHLYEDQIAFSSENPYRIEVVSKPATIQFYDPVSKIVKQGYQGQAVFSLKIALPESGVTKLGIDATIPLKVRFQACSEKLCLLPAGVNFAMMLTQHAHDNVTIMPSIIERISKTLKAHLSGGNVLSFSTLAILLLAGLVTAFTPCVYPLYPITLGIFARWAHGSAANAFLLSLTYCLGLCLSYASLGVVSTLTGHVFGSLTQTPAFLIGVGVLILLSAIFFSGLLNFPMPEKLQNFFARAEDPDKPSSVAHHFVQALGMGAGLGIVASPCVGPVLVALLAWLAASAKSFEGFILLFVFGMGMSLPFLVLGHIVIRMGRHPHLGRFTPWFKSFGTLLMIVASLVFLVPGLQLLRAQSSRGTPTTAHEMKFEVHSLTGEHPWKKEKLTLLDFRADWCAACLEIESETLPDPIVAKFFESKQLDYVRVDLTQSTPENTGLAQSFGVVSLPTILFAAPGGRICTELSLFGFESVQELKKRIELALSGCR